MKKINYLLFAGLLSLGLISCGGSGEQNEEQEGAETEVCNYEYNEGTTILEWTAFKTTAKVPVAGSFNDIKVTSESGPHPKAVIESISFSINTASVESNNEDRNKKIAEHFFGTNNTPTIEGKIKSLEDDGRAIVEITMNGITIDIHGKYTLEGPDFSFNATIDMVAWNGMAGIEALNEVCKDLHTGEDGVSKLWSEISISLTTRLKSDCNTPA